MLVVMGVVGGTRDVRTKPRACLLCGVGSPDQQSHRTAALEAASSNILLCLTSALLSELMFYVL